MPRPDIASKTFVSKCKYDDGLFSDPFAIMNLLWDYERCQNISHFCTKHHLSLQRMKSLVKTRNMLRQRVAQTLQCDIIKLSYTKPPRLMLKWKIMILRLIQVWVFQDTIIEMKYQLTHDFIDYEQCEYFFWCIVGLLIF